LGLHATYQLAEGTQVALETGTVAFFVARQLSRLGLDPIVVDAHEVRLKAHRPNQKSDGRDALELCEGLRRGIYRSIVHVPRPEISRLRDTLSRRRHFVRLQAAQVGAVKALLRAAGLVHLSRSPWKRGRLGQGDRGGGTAPGAASLRRATPRAVALCRGAGHSTRRFAPGSS
jgi:transposase